MEASTNQKEHEGSQEEEEKAATTVSRREEAEEEEDDLVLVNIEEVPLEVRQLQIPLYEYALGVQAERRTKSRERRHTEVACTCANSIACSLCLDTVLGYEQLSFNEEHPLYKTVVRLLLTALAAGYVYYSVNIFKKRWRLYKLAPYWVRYSHVLTDALGDGATKRQPSIQSTDSLDPEAISKLIRALYGDKYSESELAELELNHCNRTDVVLAANGKTDNDHCSMDATMYREGCRAGYYWPVQYRGENTVDVARPCPPGFFCLRDMVCYLACPLGSACIQSAKSHDASTCKFWEHVDPGAKPQAIAIKNSNGTWTSRNACPGVSHVTLCAEGYFCNSPDQMGTPCTTGHYCALGSRRESKCRWYESCQGSKRKAADRTIFTACVASSLLALAVFTSSIWVRLARSMRNRRKARKHKLLQDDERELTYDASDVTASRSSTISGASGKLDAKISKRRHCARLSLSILRVFASVVYTPLTARDPRSIFRQDASKRLCLGMAPRSHLQVLVVCGAAAIALGFLSLFITQDSIVHVAAFILSALCLMSSVALCAFQRAEGAPTFFLCSKEAHAVFAAIGSALALGLAITRLLLSVNGIEYYAMTALAVALVGFVGVTVLLVVAERQNDRLQQQEEDSDQYVALPIEENATLEEDDDEDSPIELAIDLDFQNLGLRLHASGQQVLRGVTGSCKNGRVTAIMGPSGAGKTTLLNVLSARASYGRVTGRILFNGTEDSVQSFGPFCGYVPQHDIMYSNLSVGETVEYYGELRLPRHFSHYDVRRVAEKCLDMLGLDRIENSIIGNEEIKGISGGEKKRVNVAMEMVAQPSILFLDEPTSGLDSTTSLELVQALRALARKRVNVIVVLHQPSYAIFRLFHDVLLLCRGGRTVYLGPSEDALSYFESLGFRKPTFDNPADFFLDIISDKAQLVRISLDPSENKDNDVAVQSAGAKYLDALDREDSKANRGERHAEALVALWDTESTRRGIHTEFSVGGIESRRASRVTRQAARRLQRAVRKMPTSLSQFVVFFRRALLQLARERHQFLLDCCISLACGAFFGLLYRDFEFNDMITLLFMLSLGVGLTSALASLRVFGADRAVFWREAAPGSGMDLDPLAFFLAKNVVELPRLAALTICTLATFVPLANPIAPVEELFVLTFFAMFAVSGFAYALSIAQDPKSSQLSCVLLILVFTLFSSVSPKLSEIDNMGPIAQFFSSISYGRWYIESLYTSQTRKLSDAWKMPSAWYNKPSKDNALQGLFSYSYSELYRHNGNLVNVNQLNIPILLAIGIAARVIAFFLLLLCNRDKMGKASVLTIVITSIINPLQNLADDLAHYLTIIARALRTSFSCCCPSSTCFSGSRRQL